MLGMADQLDVQMHTVHTVSPIKENAMPAPGSLETSFMRVKCTFIQVIII